MTATAAAADAAARPSAGRVLLARAAARHPEWWIVGIALGAWAAIVVPAVWPDDGVGVHHHGGHAGSSAATYLQAMAAWSLMVLAMMLLVAVPRVRFVATVCPGRVRAQAIAQTVAGIVLVWLALGLVVSVLPVVVPTAAAGRAPLAFVAIWAIAAAWQLTPWKWTSLVRCHGVRVPRRPGDGLARVRMGARHGAWCAASCGPAMVAMVLTGHPLLLMIGLTIGLATERVATRPVPAFRLVGVATTAIALATVGLASIGA